jgi:uncharacterized membrane protein YeaQ/YmgE (transglycosylase-associated protein family)
METINLIMISSIAGVLTAVVLASKPYQVLLSFLNLNTFQLLNCGLCLGYWVSSVIVAQYSGLLIGLMLGGVGAFVSELVTRKLNTIEL